METESSAARGPEIQSREIQRAHPAARRRAALLALAATAVGLPSVWAVQHYRHAWVAWLDANLAELREHLWIVPVVALLAMAPLVAFAVWMRRIGSRVVQARRFPPPDHRVVRDTPVLTGDAAATRGRLLQGFAVALGAACLCVPALAWLVVRALLR